MSKTNLGHDLSGLIRFAERAPWDEMLDDMLALHLDPVCEASGLDPEAIFDAVGRHWEGTMWGCAFENLMARETEADGPNLVDDYLKRRGRNEKAPNKAYTLAQMLADDVAGDGADEGPEIPPEEMVRLVHEMLAREYSQALDQPVPMLGDRTPRALGATPPGS